MATTTLAAIQDKVRKLTRSPSSAQITNDQLNEYINTFVLYDFPEELRLFALKTTFTFYTNIFQDVYETSTDSTNPLYDFKNKYITVNPPVYIAGFKSFFSQSPSEFFNIYPFNNSIKSIGIAGDGVTTTFSGFLTGVPMVRNRVTFSSVYAFDQSLKLYPDDSDPEANSSNLTGDGSGVIDYSTGEFTLIFDNAPDSGAEIMSETVPYTAGRPSGVLYFDNKFTIRPIPDRVYPVQIEVYKRPTELADGDSPELEQWWQYISYGAARLIFQDRMDMESVQMIMPELKRQERLVLRRTIVQNTNERTATIYSQQASIGAALNNNNGFNGF